jgi:hypothetical protein
MKQLSIDEVREILSEQITKINKGDGDIDIADSVANMAGKLLKSVAIEISYAEHISKGGKMIEMMEK